MKLLKRLDEWLIAILLAAMTLLTFAQVVMRYVFNSGFTWAQELTTILFAFMIFIGISYGVRVGAHIGVDAAVKSLGAGAARVVSSIAIVLCIAYALIVAFGSFQYVYKIYSVGILMQDIPIQTWIPRIVLPLGFLLLAFRFSQVLWRLATGQDAHLLGDEAEEALRLKDDPSFGEVRK